MHLLFLDQWFSDQLLKAFCWTLIHSLWQGLIAAAMAGIIIISTKKSSARLRYNLLGSVFILFLISSSITFYWEASNYSSVDAVAGQSAQVNAGTIFIMESASEQHAATVTTIEVLTGWLNSNAGLFMGWWAIFFIFNCLKLMAGIGSVQRLRSYRTHNPTIQWQDKLQELADSVGVTRQVKLLQSELIKVPVMIGFLKPVILLPLGLLAQLPADQVETILLHELAHIRRRDYVVNLLQRFAESIYFFNPAILWISSLIRQEREACCDDIVMAHTNSKLSYVEALVSFEEFQTPVTNYAMSIGTKRNYLLNRVKRILTRENKKLNMMEKIFLATGLVVLMAFTVMPRENNIPTPASAPMPVAEKSIDAVVPTPVPAKAAAVQKKKVKKPITISNIDTTDTTKKKKPVNYDDLNFPSMSTNSNDDGKTRTETTTATDQNGKKYSITRINDKITSLTIDGKAIPENEFANHSSLIQKIDHTRQVHREASRKAAEGRRISMEERKIATLHRTELARNEKQMHLDRERLAKDHSRLVERQQDEMKRMNDEHKRQRDMNRKEDLQLQKRQREEMDRLREKNRRELDINRKQREQYMEQQRIYRLKQKEELQRVLNNTTQNFNKYEPMKGQKLSVEAQAVQLKLNAFQPVKPFPAKLKTSQKFVPMSTPVAPVRKANRSIA